MTSHRWITRWGLPFAGALILLPGGCLLGTDPDHLDLSIAGPYVLTRVDGESLPCCAETDSAGTRVSVVGGTLTLGQADPGPYMFVPAGFPMPVSCVHEIPDGAQVDRDGLVTLPNGETYTIPPCGDGDYELTLDTRYEHPDGTSETKPVVISQRYTWGWEALGDDEAAADHGLVDHGFVTLVGKMAGTFARSGSGTTLSMHDPYLLVPPQDLRTWEFSSLPATENR